MSKFTDNLWRDLAREHGATIAHTERPDAKRLGSIRARMRRPRVLAGGTLGLAGIGAGVTLILSGTAVTAPAFAVTTNDNGSVLVQMNYDANENLPQVNAKRVALGTGEEISIFMAPGPANITGAVTCKSAPGATGPTVRVLVGADGTEVIAPGESADNTAVGTFHMVSCMSHVAWNNSSNTGYASAAGYAGNSGSSH